MATNGPGLISTLTIDPVLSWISALFSLSGLGVDRGDLVVVIGAATALIVTKNMNWSILTRKDLLKLQKAMKKSTPVYLLIFRYGLDFQLIQPQQSNYQLLGVSFQMEGESFLQSHHATYHGVRVNVDERCTSVWNFDHTFSWFYLCLLQFSNIISADIRIKPLLGTRSSLSWCRFNLRMIDKWIL